jgi:DNA-binding MarR family transcriptional regulator
LTAKGRRLEELIRHHAEAADQRIAEVLGERRSAQLRQALEELSTKLTSERSSKEAAR